MKAVTLIAVIVGAGFVQAASIQPGIEQLHRLDLLPQFKSSVKVGSFSSYDRTGGNNDGFSGEFSFIRKEEGGLVLAELEGPGVIWRIWTPTPTNDVMEFFFDGAEEPVLQIPFRELFTGSRYPFVRPVVGYGAGGFYSYLPLPFARSCKIRIKAERIQFYQINYAVYPAGTVVETFSATPSEAYRGHLTKAAALFGDCGVDISGYAAGARAKIATSAKDVTLKGGQSATVFESKRAGRIVGLRFSPAKAFEGKGRAIVLKAFWDGDKEPAVLCPAGDFFGYAWGRAAMQSLLAGTAGDAAYCYFPMPFARSGRIVLESDDPSAAAVNVRAEVMHCDAGLRADEGRFYALWRRENPTTKGKPFTFIETEGKGHLVGCIQQSQGMESGNTYFFEGDDQTTIDGELVIHGTGSEDFYNGGWYDVPGRWESRKSFVLSGCLGYDKPVGRTGGYRFMIGDAYAYNESVLQTIEHAPTENGLINDYCGVTFLYSKERPTCVFDIGDLASRRVVDLDRIVFATWWGVPIYAFSFQNATISKNGEKFEGQDQRFLSFKAEPNDWFGHPFIAFTCRLPAAGKYRVAIDAVKGPEQGIVQLFVDEAPVGQAVDLYAETRQKATGLRMAEMDLAEGDNVLLFKLTGKDEKSTALGLDLINIVCEKVQ